MPVQLRKLSPRRIFLFSFFILNGISIQMPPVVHHTITYGFSAMIIIAALTIFLSKGEITLPKIPMLALWVSLFILWNYLSATQSNNQSVAIFASLRLSLFFIVIVGLSQLLQTKEDIEIVFFSIVILSVIVSFSVLLDTYLGNVSSPNGRESGIYSSPITAGFILFLGIMFVLYKFDDTNKFLYIFLLTCFGIALILTRTRSAWLATAFSFFFFTFKSRKTTYRHLYRIIYVLIVPAIFLLSSHFLRTEDGLSGRDYIWGAALRMGQNNMLFGVGTGNFSNNITAYINLDADSWTFNSLSFAFGYAHNFFLTMFSELGIVGVLLSILILISYAATLRKLKNIVTKADLFENRIYRLAAAIFAGWIVRSFFESSGFLTAGWLAIDIYVWLLLIFVMRVTRNIKETNAQIV